MTETYSAPFRVRYNKREEFQRKQAEAKLDDPNTPLEERQSADRILKKIEKQARSRTEKRKEVKQKKVVPIRKSKRDPEEARRAAEFLDSLEIA